ncbi:MAG: hypothetical protein RL335_1250 [Bacteroidota bacterium]
MIRYALLYLVFFGCSIAEARHIAGGEMSYEYLGPGAGTNLRYRITLKLYRDCYTGGAQLDNAAAITIYPNGSSSPYTNLSVTLDYKLNSQLTTAGPCIDNPPVICYEIGYYIEIVELPASANGFTIAYQRCCRIDNISNVTNSGNAGATYAAVIPGTTISPLAPQNSSAKFIAADTVVICENNGFYYDFSAIDKDEDDLTYEFDVAYDGASMQSPQPPQASSPPYGSVNYSFPYSGIYPLGNKVTIDSKTGIISGIAPASGIYVVTVAVIERKNGIIINRHRKDLHIKVAPCSIAAATLDPEYVNCDDYKITIRNKSSSSLINSYYWDFGAPGNNDISTNEIASYTYADTGTYNVMLITNRGQDCSDTAVTRVRIYPGFTPKFTFLEGCKNVPMTFQDQTIAKYGKVNSWKWSFGNPVFNPDTARTQNPKYTYTATGSYNVQLIVGSTVGCVDTVESTINVLDKPTLKLINDTLICSIDTLKLSAMGNGSIVWSPNYMISSLSIADPLVSPDKPTMYYARLTSAPGCENLDSVFVDVRTSVTAFAGNDTTICLTDSIMFKPVTEGLQIEWLPSPDFRDPSAKNAVAIPKNTTIYTINVNLGKCGASDQIKVTTIPYPKIQAIADTFICFGETIPLSVTGAEIYRWSPSSLLSSNTINNPIGYPKSNTAFIVAGYDTKGCPKPSFDTIRVRVIPKVTANAGNDTSIVIGQPLQLTASGGSFYRWSPTTGLTDPNIANPIATLSNSTTYTLRVFEPEGCFGVDTIKVTVFQNGPDIFVPTAFTPNNDRKNDKLIPIPVGVTKIDFFRVYNRYGQLVYSTTNIGEGWDGRFNGQEQGSATFTWYVQGVDYTGKNIFKKGTSTLIR